MAKLSLLFLGTGSSMGVPVAACKCSVCQSSNPHNRRSRPGYLIQYQNKTLLIDASQDFRSQALAFGISHLDGVFITHAHHDHTAGIDDLRAYTCGRKILPLLMSRSCYDDLSVRYHYIFEPTHKTLSSVTKSEVHYVPPEGGAVSFAGLELYTFPFYQMGMRVDGLRIGNFAFVSDIKEYDEEIFNHLKGVEVLLISALREESSPIHFNVEDSISFSRKVGANRTYFVHIAHEVEHEALQKKLPFGFFLAYDGLKIEA